MSPVSSIRRVGISLIELLVTLAIVGVLIGLTFSGVQKVRSRAASVQCQNQLRQIGLGMANYHAAQGQLPPGVTLQQEPGPVPLTGWQARLLPHIEQGAVWAQAVEASKLKPADFTASPPHPFTTVISTYGCPADGRVRQQVLARGQLWVALGSYIGVAGTRHRREANGCLYADSRVKLTDITDGTSNMLLVGERPPSPDMWLGWWYAGAGVDWLGTGDTVLGARERATPTGYLDMPDCGPGFASYQAGRLDNMCDAMHYWSLHTGGTNFLLADGGVRFISYSGADILPALATRAGGEVVAVPE